MPYAEFCQRIATWWNVHHKVKAYLVTAHPHFSQGGVIDSVLVVIGLTNATMLEFSTSDLGLFTDDLEAS